MRILSVIALLTSIFVSIHTTVMTGISVASVSAYICIPGAVFRVLYINNPLRLQAIEDEKELQHKSNQTE
jgi:hypothetical protein